MPINFSKLDIIDVQQVLRRRGWNFQAERGVGLRLTKQDTTPGRQFKSTGKPRMIPMTPVSSAHLEEILSRSRDIKEAVEQIEAISIGAQLSPNFGGGGSSGLDPEVQERLITQRVENEVARVAERAQAAIAQQQAEIEALKEKLAKETGKKKPGPKPGKKRSSVVAKAKAKLDDEPELTEEQEAELLKLDLGPNE